MQSIILTDQDHIYTTSLLVAEKFNKKHKDVLKAVRNLDCSTEFYERNFAPIQIDTNLGLGRSRKDPAYQITRDGFAFLAMGFTGHDAAQWKEQFINAFNHMEQLLSAALANAHQAEVQAVAQELAAIMNALFDRYPQWKETAAYLQQGKSTREIAVLQGKHIRNVQKMIVRMNAAGLDCRPAIRLTQQAA